MIITPKMIIDFAAPSREAFFAGLFEGGKTPSEVATLKDGKWCLLSVEQRCRILWRMVEHKKRSVMREALAVALIRITEGEPNHSNRLVIRALRKGYITNRTLVDAREAVDMWKGLYRSSADSSIFCFSPRSVARVAIAAREKAAHEGFLFSISEAACISALASKHVFSGKPDVVDAAEAIVRSAVLRVVRSVRPGINFTSVDVIRGREGEWKAQMECLVELLS